MTSNDVAAFLDGEDRTTKRRPKTHPVQPNSLVGRFGHTYELLSDGFERVVYQFFVEGRTPDGSYIIQYYSWIMGESSHQQLVNEAWFIEHRVRFYTDIEAWRDAGDLGSAKHRVARQGGRHERQRKAATRRRNLESETRRPQQRDR